MIKYVHPLYLLIVFLFVSSCQSNGQSTPDNSSQLPSRRALARAFRDNPKVLLVYGTQNEAFTKQYKNLADSLKNRFKDYIEVELKSDTEAKPADWKDKALFVLGTPESNSIINKLNTLLPIQAQNEKIEIGKHTYRDKSTVGMLSFYPNPLSSSMPLAAFLGLQDAKVLDLVQQKLEQGWQLFSWSDWGYEVYENNKRISIGSFNRRNWEIDPAAHFDLNNSSDTLAKSSHIKYVTHGEIDDLILAKFVHHCDNSQGKLLDFIGLEKTLPEIKCHLYPNAEQKGLQLHNTDHVHVNHGTLEAHAVVNETYRDNCVGKENELLLRYFFKKPATIAFEKGLAIYFTTQWQRLGYQHWAKKLFLSENMPPLRDIMNNEMQDRCSPLVMGCLSASFVEYLIETFGKEEFLENYESWRPSEGEMGKLERNWHQYLKNSKPIINDKKRVDDLAYMKGFNFAHEGYRIYNGYISKKATEALEKLNDLGSNSVAIVPYSYMRNPNEPTFISFSNRPGSENDESVIHSAAMAKKMGMSVLLKPQIWFGRGSWPGDVEMTSEEDWQQFFEHYHRWICHYAMLAEIHEMELFCLGVEFVKSTTQRGDDWRKLIQKTRKLFSGKITYAANWGEEFEQVSFWDELDFIGLNCYYPLSEKQEANKRELEAGFQKVRSKIEDVSKQYQKPIVFTEIGFRSIEAPWKSPHAEAENSAYDSEHQKRCYEIIFEGIQNQDWCKGIFWWKFPSYIEYRGGENRSFTPNGKPAEEVVKKWFGLMDSE